MVSFRRNRAGISLLEIMISIGIVGIGLLGVAALIPLAHYKAAEGVREERKALFGKRAFREFVARGFHRPGTNVSVPGTTPTAYWMWDFQGRWFDVYQGKEFQLTPQAYCFDPHGVAAAPPNDARRWGFPVKRAGVPDSLLSPRVTVCGYRPHDFPNFSDPYLLSFPAAEEIFRLRDDVIVEPPENIDDIAYLSYLTESVGSNSPPIASKRATGGSFSWMATLVPELNSALDPAQPGIVVPYLTNRYQLSIVVFNQRDLSGLYAEETVAQIDTQNSLLSGPAKEILIEQVAPFISPTPTLEEERSVGVRNIRQGDWIALVQRLLPPQFPYTHLQWYQVQSTDELDTEYATRRQLSLSGPDWNPNPLQPIYAVYVRNVVSVYQKSIELQH